LLALRDGTDKEFALMGMVMLESQIKKDSGA
jgi:hypothetical protein